MTEIVDRKRLYMLRNSFWTTDRCVQLAELYKQRLSIPKIAQIMGTTRGSVSGKLFRDGMMPPRDEPVDTPQAKKRRENAKQYRAHQRRLKEAAERRMQLHIVQELANDWEFEPKPVAVAYKSDFIRPIPLHRLMAGR
jgi:hypothetical protein